MNNYFTTVTIDGKEYTIDRNNLYKTRDDNKLTTAELVSKYTNRIVNGTL